MFNNIFSKLKSKRIKEKIKPKIIADIHEKNSLILAELISNKEINLEIKPLKVADYLINNIAIERKTASDFVSSMINKRLIQQLQQLQQYRQKLLIIEGDLTNSSKSREDTSKKPLGVLDNAIRGFILSISINYQIPIIQTKDYKETSGYLILLAKQQLKPKQETSLHSRIPKTLKEQQKYILTSFPNIGPKTADKLLKQFKTLSNVFNASEQELKEFLGKRTSDFKKLIDYSAYPFKTFIASKSIV